MVDEKTGKIYYKYGKGTGIIQHDNSGNTIGGYFTPGIRETTTDVYFSYGPILNRLTYGIIRIRDKIKNRA